MEDSGKLVGVRAFMPWMWTKGGKTYQAIRAVDTATHPDYQGRGYASILVQHSALLMIQAGLKPFLHTAVNNTRAIELYRRLGFVENEVITLNGIRRL